MSLSPHILVLNCGSSSIKFAVIDLQSETTLLSGLAERLNQPDAQMQYRDAHGKATLALEATDHRAAIQAMVKLIRESGHLERLSAVGHRIVHGGEHFQSSCRIDATQLERIRDCSRLAPLHNPAQVLGIEITLEAFAQLPQVAVFDTSFHQSMPEKAFIYPLPFELYQQQGIRRYGFHGTSHRYVSAKAAQLLGRPLAQCSFISAHLGNGCSLAAIELGRSCDTSMGFTPLEGLMMGTRCGDIDASIPGYLAQTLNLTPDAVNRLLNHQSGLLGISGLSNDMRSLLEAEAQGHARAHLAIELFCYRLAKYIASLMVPLSRLDALIFTGGIGENASAVRARVVAQLRLLGFELEPGLNAQHGQPRQGRISTDASRPVWVIATNEELLIAQDTLALTAQPSVSA